MDEIECTNKRRSSRIIALEEKKQKQERERKLALERKNHDIRNKGKGKATVEVGDDESSHFNEVEEGPTKKRCKSKELYQLISSIKSIQELQRQSLNASTSGTNVSSQNDMPLKHILEIITDFLQREDPDELFAAPVNPDVVKNYYEIVKQPMDFGTVRAKLHEGMYKNLEQFKRDVFLICSNAMNANPTNSKYYEVAEDISRYAKWIFEALNADPQHVGLEFPLNKKRPARKPQNGQKRTSRFARVAPKRVGRNNATYVTVPETEKRDMYRPPSQPLVSLVLHANKPDIHLNKNPNQYKESLLQFVKDLEPTAQRVAAKKLEAHQQLCNGETQNQNILENVSRTQIIHQPTPNTPTQPAALNSQTLPPPLPFLSRPLTIPGSAAKGIRNVNTTNAGIVDNRHGLYQGNKTNSNDSWHTCSAALLSSFFFNNDKGRSPGGIESPNARETMNFRNLSKGKMVSPLENVSSLLGHQLGVNKSSNTRQWNTSTGIPNILASGSSSNVSPIVHQTRMILGPQPRPLMSVMHNAGNRNSFSRLSLMPQPRSEDTMPSINLPELSLVSQSRPENFMSCMPSNNLTELSLVRQPRPDGIINLSDLSLVSQPRPKDLMYDMFSNNRTELSLVHHPWQEDSMSSLNPLRVSPLSQPKQGEPMPSKKLPESTILPSLDANFSIESNTSLYGLGTLYQQRDFQGILDLPDLNHSACTMQANHEQVMHQTAPYTPPATQGFPYMQMQVISQLNPPGPVPLLEPKSPSALEMALGGGGGEGGALIGQPDEAPPQLLWDDDQQPNLALHL